MSFESPQYQARRRLDGVQALRGIASLLVVFFHAAAIWREHSGALGRFGGVWDQGYAGVDLFFVISGFIMVWVAGERERGAATAGRFLFDRATRVYPLWWVCCAAMAAYFLATYGQPAPPNLTGPGGAWGYVATSLALWPQSGLPVLQVGWTLVFEMGFYLVFAGLLLLPRRWRLFVLGLWAAALLLRLGLSQGLVEPAPVMPGSPLGVLMHPLVLEFLMGAAVGYVLPRWRDEGWAKFVFAAGCLGFAVWSVLGLDVADPDFPAARVLVFGVPAALLLAGLVKTEQAGGLSGKRRVPRGLIALGNASYALYLTHFIVLLTLKRVFGAVGILDAPTGVSLAGFMLIGTVASVATGLATYRWVERPLLRASRRVWPRATAS